MRLGAGYWRSTGRRSTLDCVPESFSEITSSDSSNPGGGGHVSLHAPLMSRRSSATCESAKEGGSHSSSNPSPSTSRRSSSGAMLQPPSMILAERPTLKKAIYPPLKPRAVLAFWSPAIASLVLVFIASSYVRVSSFGKLLNGDVGQGTDNAQPFFTGLLHHGSSHDTRDRTKLGGLTEKKGRNRTGMGLIEERIAKRDLHEDELRMGMMIDGTGEDLGGLEDLEVGPRGPPVGRGGILTHADVLFQKLTGGLRLQKGSKKTSPRFSRRAFKCQENSTEGYIVVKPWWKGLNNQRNALLKAVLLAKYLNATLVLPGIYTNYDPKKARPSICPGNIETGSDCTAIVPFSRIFNESAFKERMEKELHLCAISHVPAEVAKRPPLNSDWEELSKKDQPCVDDLKTVQAWREKLKESRVLYFSRVEINYWSLFHESFPLYMRFRSIMAAALRASAWVKTHTERIIARMPNEDGLFSAVHLRIEDDWHKFCRTHAGMLNMLPLGCFFSIVDVRTFLERIGIPKTQPLYIASGAAPYVYKTELSKSFHIVSKDTLLANFTLQIPHRELRAAIEQEVLFRSQTFVGVYWSSLSLYVEEVRSSFGLPSFYMMSTTPWTGETSSRQMELRFFRGAFSKCHSGKLLRPFSYADLRLAEVKATTPARKGQPIKICLWSNITTDAYGGSQHFFHALAMGFRERGHSVALTTSCGPDTDLHIVNQIMRWSKHFRAILLESRRAFIAGQSGRLSQGSRTPSRVDVHRQAATAMLARKDAHLSWFNRRRAGASLQPWLSRKEKRTQTFRRRLQGIPVGGSKPPIVMWRVDGPFELHRGKDHRFQDVEMYAMVTKYANVTVFQSQWSYDKTIDLGHNASIVNPVIIGNAPDPKFFHPEPKTQPLIATSGRLARKVRLVAQSWATTARKGFATYKWMEDNLDWNKYEFTFIGRTPFPFERIRVLPPMPMSKLAHELRSHDIFVIASWNECNSNALGEALACGLPALALQDSSHPEVVGQAGVFFLNNDTIIPKLEYLVANYQSFQKKVKPPTLDDIVDKYLRSFSAARQSARTSR